MRCAVGSCKQNNSKKSDRNSGKHVSFYSFPKDAALKSLWIKFCNRVKTINVKNEGICSLHFKEEDFERNLKFEMGFSKRPYLKLKPGAVPTIATSNNKSIAMTTDINKQSLQPHMETLKAKEIKDLENATENGRTETSTLYVFKQLSFPNCTENASPKKQIFLINLQNFSNSYDKKKISYIKSYENFLNNQIKKVQQEADSSNQILPNMDIKIAETEVKTDKTLSKTEYSVDSSNQVLSSMVIKIDETEVKADQTLLKECDTEQIEMKSEVYQQPHSVVNCNQALRGTENKQTKLIDDLVRLPAENSKQKQDTHEPLCSLWSQKITKLGTSQRVFAEKLINDVLFNAELGLLNFYTSLSNLSPY